MITAVEIENFRCFEKLKIEDLKRVNLIGGMNNSGKTAFLEAVFLMLNQDVPRILQGRRITEDQIRLWPESTFENFFRGRDQSQKIILNFDTTGGFHLYKILSRPKQEDNLIAFSSIDPVEDPFRFDDPVFDLWAFRNTSENGIEKILYNNMIINPMAQKEVLIQASLLLPSERKNDHDLAKSYDQTELAGVSGKILDFIKIIDPDVVDIRTLSIGIPKIFLKKKDGQMISLNMFGDAINRIMEIILTLLNNRGSVLLIDEIENGIHYTKQAEFWSLLNQVTETFNVQIFASTHSREMMNAFSESFGTEGDAAYFELARKAKTGQIVALRHDLGTLKYELERNMEIRGE